VAARGAVLYFCIVEMALVSWMYNTSLQQFLELFEWSIDHAEKAAVLPDRVENIINEMTYKVYRYVNRGLFEKDKDTFKIMVALKILIKRGHLEQKDVGFFLKAGSSIEDRNKQFSWMENKTWLNIKALSQHRFGNSHALLFKEIVDKIARTEPAWRKWIEYDEPENEDVPDYHEKI
jgi:dynein heavy chain